MSNNIVSQHNRKHTVSVVMIVKNEAENLKISLPAVADWVDEIIILDSGSTDESKEIAEQYGAKWFVNSDWPGFGKQKQLAQSYASGDWILALDADEEIGSELKKSIMKIVSTETSNIVYGLRRIDYIFGHPIDSTKWVVPIKAYWRLYPKCFNFNDNMVHESLNISNSSKTKVLAGYLKHHTAPNLNFLLQKRLDYANIWAIERHRKNKKTNIFIIIIASLWSFMKVYFIEGRLMTGAYGLIYSIIFSHYTFNKYLTLYELQKKETINEK